MRILALSPSSPPAVTPTANRVAQVFSRLGRDHELRVLTTVAGRDEGSWRRILVPRTPTPASRLRSLLARARLGRVVNLLENYVVWPDADAWWIAPAVERGHEVVRSWRPDVILVFMMPYSAGVAGMRLAEATGVPLVMYLGDSPTCDAMHPSFPTASHYRRMVALEDRFVRAADAIIWNSARTKERVQARQPADQRHKFHLIRSGVATSDLPEPVARSTNARFEVLYTGGMTGWYEYFHGPRGQGALRRVYQRLLATGRHRLADVDYRGSTPVPMGRALQLVLGKRPEWRGRARLRVVGNTYPRAVVSRVLENAGLEEIVAVDDAVSHRDAMALLQSADALLIALPDRPDGAPDARISSKTYEYLATDRPIIAAIPAGENEDYLRDKPGVTVVRPTDSKGMARALEPLMEAFFNGTAVTFDRSRIREELSYDRRVAELERVLREVVQRDSAAAGPEATATAT